MNPTKQAETTEAASRQTLFVPHPSRWFEFAHQLDGYQIAEELSLDLAELDHQATTSLHSDGEWEGSLLELRLVLFFRARAVRFVGGLADDHEFEAEIGALLNTIALAEDQRLWPTDQDPKAEYLPEELELSIGGYWPPSYSVKWQDGRLVFEGRERGRNSFDATEIRILRFARPTGRRWQGFWKTLEEIGAWDWRSEYLSPAQDGTGWHISVTRHSKRMSSRGSNAYPSNAYPPDDWRVTHEFRRYLRAVRRLLGGLPFA